MTDDLVAFLRARLDEVEQTAELMAQHYPSPWDASDRGWMAHVVADGPGYREVMRLEQWSGQPSGQDAPWLGDIIAHIARHDPARVLRDVEAKRRIVEECAYWNERAVNEAIHPPKFPQPGLDLGLLLDAMNPILRHLALPYDGHPDYREKWRP